MSNTKHLLHKKSCVVANGIPKLPSAEDIEFGEIAINYAEGYETISLKNANDNVVTFSTDAKLSGYVDSQINEVKNELMDVEEAVVNTLGEIQSGAGLSEYFSYAPNTSNVILSGATSLANADELLSTAISNVQTTIDGIDFSTVYKFMGTVESYNKLPTLKNTKTDKGKTYNVNDTGANYAWTGTAWDKLSETYDFSGYATTGDVKTMSETLSSYTDTQIESVSSQIDPLSGQIESLSGQMIQNESVIVATFKAIKNLLGCDENFQTNASNTVTNITNLTNVPITSKLVIADIAENSNLSLESNLSTGQEIRIIVHNTSSDTITITLPTTLPYVNLSENSFDLLTSKYTEINCISDGSKVYIKTINGDAVLQ